MQKQCAIIPLMKKTIQEVIIVEGKHDMERLLRLFDVDVLYSSGTHLSAAFLQRCQELNAKQGIIVFTDPDGPGEYIRRTIREAVGVCKHASLSLKQSKRHGKVGIEHATDEDLIEALKEANYLDTRQSTISWDDFLELGLSGHPMSQAKRDVLMEAYHLPRSNAKTCFKYLNMIGKNVSDVLETLEGSR
mgnify:CR=1 FL=1